MATGQPFNELGQILSEGGEIALGLKIIEEDSRAGFLLFFNRRFQPIREEDAVALERFSESMVRAGENLQALPLDATIGTRDIPLNEFLFGGDLQGRRVLITGEVELEGLDNRIQIRLPFADIPTIQEIREAFLDRSRDIVTGSPEKFLPFEATPTTGGKVFILLPERAF